MIKGASSGMVVHLLYYLTLKLKTYGKIKTYKSWERLLGSSCI